MGLKIFYITFCISSKIRKQALITQTDGRGLPHIIFTEYFETIRKVFILSLQLTIHFKK